MKNNKTFTFLLVLGATLALLLSGCEADKRTTKKSSEPNTTTVVEVEESTVERPTQMESNQTSETPEMETTSELMGESEVLETNEEPEGKSELYFEPLVAGNMMASDDSPNKGFKFEDTEYVVTNLGDCIYYVITMDFTIDTSMSSPIYAMVATYSESDELIALSQNYMLFETDTGKVAVTLEEVMGDYDKEAYPLEPIVTFNGGYHKRINYEDLSEEEQNDFHYVTEVIEFELDKME